MPINKESFVADFRKKNPTVQGSDQQIIDSWVRTHPQDASLFQEDDDEETKKLGGLARGAAAALRIVPPIVGNFLGGGITPAASAFGAAGGAGGEGAAQLLEKFLGARSEFNPAAVAANAAVGAIPFGKVAQGARRGAIIAKEAGRGAGIGAGSSAALQLGETGEIDAKEVLLGGALGGVLGGGTATFATRKLAQPKSSFVSKELEELAEARTGSSGSSLKDRITEGAEKVQTVAVASRTPFNKAIERQTKKAGIKLTTDQDPRNHFDLKLGSITANDVDAANQLDDIYWRVRGNRLEAPVNQLLDLRAFEGGAEILHAKVTKGVIKAADLKTAFKAKGLAKLTKDLEAKKVSEVAALQKTVDKILRAKVRLLKGKPKQIATANRDAEKELQLGIAAIKKKLAKERKIGRLTIDQGARRAYNKASTKGVGIANKLTQGEALPVGFTPEKVTKQLADLEKALGPEQFAKVDELAEEVIQFNSKTLEIMHDAELISDDIFNAYRGVKHIPLKRIMEENSQISLRKGKGVFQELKGSKKATLDPGEASLLARKEVNAAAADNESKIELLKWRELDPSFTKIFPEVKAPKGGSTGLPPKVAEGDAVITVFSKGVPRYFSAQENVANSINSLDAKGADLLGQAALGFFSSLTKRAATGANIAFSFGNVLRDVQATFVGSGISARPDKVLSFVGGTWAKALGQILLQNTVRGTRKVATAIGAEPTLFKLGLKLKVPKVAGQAELRAAGGASSTHQQQLNRAMGGGQEGTGVIGTMGNVINRALDIPLAPISGISDSFEQATKIASWNRLGQEGMSGVEQAINVRRYGGSPDFGVHGTGSKELGNLILFFNAQVQGISRMLRLVTEKPKRALGAATGLAALEISRMTWNAQFYDPDGTQVIDRITTADKENYWTFVSPEMEVVGGVERRKVRKIPKDHYFRLLGNPIADALHAAYSDREEFNPTQTAINTGEQLLPGNLNIDTDDPLKSLAKSAGSSVNPLLKIPAELMSNENFYSRTPIESRSQENLLPSERSSTYTSSALQRGAKLLAEHTGIEVSPIKAQHIIQGFVPGPGEQVLKFADQQLEGESLIASAGAAFAEPLKRRFKGSPGDQVTRNQSNRLYKALDKSRMLQATYRKLSVEDPAEAQAFLNKHSTLLSQRKMLDKASQQLSEWSKFPDDQVAPLKRALLRQVEKILDGS